MIDLINFKYNIKTGRSEKNIKNLYAKKANVDRHIEDSRENQVRLLLFVTIIIFLIF